MPLRVLILVVGLASVLGSDAAWAALDWIPYVNARFGFSFRYPANLFEPERRSEEVRHRR